jgi:hypothetical protein
MTPGERLNVFEGAQKDSWNSNLHLRANLNDSYKTIDVLNRRKSWAQKFYAPGRTFFVIHPELRDRFEDCISDTPVQNSMIVTEFTGNGSL